jgi:hypothetical protein
MKEQTKVRLDIITSRHARRISDVGGESEVAAAQAIAFARDYERAIAAVVRPAMEEIGAELARSGHGYRVEEGQTEGRRTLAFYVLITGARRDAANVIRFFLASYAGRSEVIAEVEFARNPMELTRYREIEGITAAVIEQLLVDAVEHIFACNGG